MGRLDLVEFEDNPEPRCPCMLVLDTSGSMAGSPIKNLNAGLQTLSEELRSDSLASLRVEVGVITFGRDDVQMRSPFTTADEWVPPKLEAGGLTPMGEAIELAMNQLDARKDSYKQAGVPYYRPWLIVMTDGGPTDDWETAARRLHRLEAAKAVLAFGVGVGDADFEVLRQLSPRPPKALRGLQFREFFLWLSQSQRQVSASVVGEQVPLPPTSGWEYIDS